MHPSDVLRLSLDPATREELEDDVIHGLVGGRAGVIGPWQVAWLERHGMTPESRVLDLGCGTLRGGLPIMARLHAGHYTGVEPLGELLALGRFLVDRHRLADRHPNLHTLGEWDTIASVHEFDFILTQSVLNHLDAAGIGQTIDRVAASLVDDGFWLTTVALSESVDGVRCGRAHPWREGEWWKSVMHPTWFAEQVVARGLQLVAMPDTDHPAGLTTAILRRA
jgi:SAM-dependent methyltransferase